MLSGRQLVTWGKGRSCCLSRRADSWLVAVHGDPPTPAFSGKTLVRPLHSPAWRMLSSLGPEHSTCLCTYSLSLCDACPPTRLTRRADPKSSPPHPGVWVGFRPAYCLHTHPGPSAEKCSVQLCDPVGCGQPRFWAGCKPLHGLFSQV